MTSGVHHRLLRDPEQGALDDQAGSRRQVGANDVHLYATTPDGQPADVKEWRVRASLPAQGIEPIDATVLPITPSHATGQINLPTAGLWTFSFTLRTSETDQATVTADLPIRP